MNTGTWIAVAVAVAIVIILVAWMAVRRRRTIRLHERFGPEYDRTVERAGTRREAEIDLRDRAQQRDRLDLRPLPAAARARYADEWRRIQQRFVDRPADALADADALLSTVMRDRGYPVGDDFEARADLVSVDHPAMVENYRAGHAVVERDRVGQASTEDLRQALVRYRSLFDELLDVDGDRDMGHTSAADMDRSNGGRKSDVRR